MMMMDISMYSHHNQHGATSYNSDANCYNYSSDHHTNSQQFQSPYFTNYHYEDAYLYASSTTDGADLSSSQDVNYYHPQHLPENSIINTDSGLSYTNLDYANTNSNTIYHHGSFNDNYRPDGIHHHQDDSSDNYSANDHKYPVDHPNHNYHHAGQVNASLTGSCLDFQHLRYKDEISGNDQRIRQSQAIHNLNPVSQTQPVLPTYKWMQVKRNVPKSTGKSFLNSDSFDKVFDVRF